MGRRKMQNRRKMQKAHRVDLPYPHTRLYHPHPSSHTCRKNSSSSERTHLRRQGGGGGHGTATPSHSLRQSKYVSLGGLASTCTFATLHTLVCVVKSVGMHTLAHKKFAHIN
jgi:hypothetical protein